ncbi:MAG: acetyl-CoA carboxylase carboxyl transferase subunit alpha, partial [Terriglobus sp.]
ASKRQQAAEALKYTAPDVSRLGCVDGVIAEPAGGAQANPDEALAIVRSSLQQHFAELKAQSIDDLLKARYNKFRNIAAFYTTA